MARGDYLLCGDCQTKLVYDGDWSGRDRVLEVFGEGWTTLVCPPCLVRRDAAVRRAALEEAARDCEKFAEEIKHTSHKDGLGMGDQRSEGVLKEQADHIRALSDEPAQPNPLTLDPRRIEQWASDMADASVAAGESEYVQPDDWLERVRAYCERELRKKHNAWYYTALHDVLAILDGEQGDRWLADGPDMNDEGDK